MSELIIDENGDFAFPGDNNTDVTQTGSSTILILENSASASLLFGCADQDGLFVAYPAGEFNDGAVINHGRGCKLMVRVSGITGDTVTISRFPRG